MFCLKCTDQETETQINRYEETEIQLDTKGGGILTKT